MNGMANEVVVVLKRVLLVFSVVGVMLLMIGCGGGQGAKVEEGMKAHAAAQDGAPMTERKVLVAYYSLTKTTQRAAEKIHARTGGDLFEILASDPYPVEHDPCLERDMREIEANARPSVVNTVADMGQYDVIFIGYPIWYYQAPMLINTFLESYSFQGKTVIPFCTSGGYPIDNSIDRLRDSMPGATIAEGLRVEDDDELAAWLDKLGFAAKAN